MRRDRNDRGRYADGIDPETVMDVFDAREDTARPVTASDVVDELGIARRTAHNKLNALVERGVLDTRKIGARGRVWWIPNLREEDAAHAPRTVEPDDAAEGPDERQTPSGGAHGDESDTLEDRARERITDLNLPGSGKDYDRRRDAVLKMYNHLRDHAGERLSKSDFRELLDGDDVGYGAGFASLWANWVKGSGDRPNVLDELPHVELRGDDYVYEVGK
jgi:hypothetical protein